MNDKMTMQEAHKVLSRNLPRILEDLDATCNGLPSISSKQFAHVLACHYQDLIADNKKDTDDSFESVLEAFEVTATRFFAGAFAGILEGRGIGRSADGITCFKKDDVFLEDGTKAYIWNICENGDVELVANGDYLNNCSFYFFPPEKKPKSLKEAHAEFQKETEKRRKEMHLLDLKESLEHATKALTDKDFAEVLEDRIKVFGHVAIESPAINKIYEECFSEGCCSEAMRAFEQAEALWCDRDVEITSIYDGLYLHVDNSKPTYDTTWLAYKG